MNFANKNKENNSISKQEQAPCPANIQSGWLPKPGHPSLKQFFTNLLDKTPKEYAPCIKVLDLLFDVSPVLNSMLERSCAENENLIASNASTHVGVDIPRISNKSDLLNAFNHILTQAPAFIDEALVGLPFSAFVVGIDPTMSGSEMFRTPIFNEAMSVILKEWNAFLATAASNVGFRVEGEQWLSDTAKAQYHFEDWQKDSEELPYWSSWNSFFTRQFKNKAISRPIADPDSNQTVNCPNDGSLFRWRANIARKDAFWFKDMRYSLSDILSSDDPEQQAIIDEHNLLDLFEGGYIFQTYLNPYNYHCWWVPVNAEVLFTPFSIKGCFFNKLILPDYGGASTASLPYLAQVNARGIIVFKTEEYGHVCCIPLGMSEVSTVEFEPSLIAGAVVKKGDMMGKFNYGGSSFAIIYEKLPNKELTFVNSDGVAYLPDPPKPSGSSGAGGEITNIGSQIGIWTNVAV